jgi:hypothetical protein
MVDNIVIDIALGLILFYVVMSLAASRVQEWIATLLKLRSTNLQSGIKQLLGDDYAAKVYAHPLIKNLAKENKLPSYIDTKTLGTVLIDILSREKTERDAATPAPPSADGQGEQQAPSNGATTPLAYSFEELEEIVASIQEPAVKQVLQSLLTRTETAALDLRDSLADWFDQGMDRVSGWYARQAKSIILVIAAVLTIGMNASTIHIAQDLWTNSTLREALAAQAVEIAKQNDLQSFNEISDQTLEKFPIGWNTSALTCDGVLSCIGAGLSAVTDASLSEILKHLLGWFLTIAAISLGAPFWFDLLGKVANLKGSGGKPGSPQSNQTRTT